jgi:hypothetical protein
MSIILGGDLALRGAFAAVDDAEAALIAVAGLLREGGRHG